MKMFRLKFQQNSTINEGFDYFFFGGGREKPPGVKRAPIHKFLSKLLLVNKILHYFSNSIKIAQQMKNLNVGREGGGDRGDEFSRFAPFRTLLQKFER